MNNELYHYGVKGMKWGHRKSNAVNKNYTAKQRKQDRAFYGSRGEKRINKKLNQGHGLRGARHYEAERKERNAKRKKMVQKGVRRATKVLGTIGSLYITDKVFYGGAGTKSVKYVGKKAAQKAISSIGKMRGIDVTWL